jgi:UDP-glucose:tetrahydrobiopterin glucosyltransferase
MRLLCVSTPVGPLGSGIGGGVELTLTNVVRSLTDRGHDVTVLAPEGSQLPLARLWTEAGALQRSAQTLGRAVPATLADDGVLARMWARVRATQSQFDVILNFAYDALPFQLTPVLATPVAHLVSMGSLSDAMDTAIAAVARSHPGHLALHSRAQAETFPFAADWRVMANGLDLDGYEFVAEPGPWLGWVGRLSAEKGLEDAVVAAVAMERPLRIWGAITEPDYWTGVQRRFPTAQLEYRGFLPTSALQAELGQCQGLVMTPKWVEAFGNVAIEALACGVPVVSYRRGGPTEILTPETGYLAEPDDLGDLQRGIAALAELDRRNCRARAEQEYSLAALGARFEAWLEPLIRRC